MSDVIQQRGITAGLFSSALFCLWLSTASLAVLLDVGVGTEARPQQSVRQPDKAPEAQPAPASEPTGGRVDAA